MIQEFEHNGEYYFHAKEFGKQKLRYSSQHFDNIIRELPEKYKIIRNDEIFINVAGLLIVTMRSAKTEARVFQVYIVDKLLPYLRQQYTKTEIEKKITPLQNEIKMLNEALREKNKQYNYLLTQLSSLMKQFSGVIEFSKKN